MADSLFPKDADTVGLWWLNDTTPFDDESGRGNHLDDWYTSQVSGKIGYARNWDETYSALRKTSGVNLPKSLFTTNGITVEIVVWLNSLKTVDFILKTINGEFGFRLRGLSDYLYFYVDFSGGSSGRKGWKAGVLTGKTGQWLYIVGMSNGDGSAIKLYLNGSEITGITEQDESSPDFGSGDQLFVGNDIGYTYEIDGKVQEIRISNVMRTAGEIADLWKTLSTDPYPVLLNLQRTIQQATARPRLLNVQRNIEEYPAKGRKLNIQRTIQGTTAYPRLVNVQRTIQGANSFPRLLNVQRNIQQALTEDIRVQAWDGTNAYVLSSLLFKLMLPGQTYTDDVWLWNDKDGDLQESQTMIEVEVGVLCGNGQWTGQKNHDGQEVIDELWAGVKSNGVLGSGIVDDAEAGYTPVGGLTRHPIGDIPSQCARKLHIKIEPPVGADTITAWALLVVFFEVE